MNARRRGVSAALRVRLNDANDRVYAHPCRYCQAPAGRPCTTKAGGLSVQAHTARLTAWDRRDSDGCTRKGCGKPKSEHEYGVFCP